MQQRLELLSQPQHQGLLAGMVHGVEKESLRVGANGQLALTPHPKTLGSALTHPAITTDFSEALLEFITPPVNDHRDTLQTLEQMHRYTCRQIGDELLWVNSMPCALGADADIPEARYGTSNVGKMKRVYRIGLGHRYGRRMQTIAGIHYNFSLPDSLWQLLQQTESRSCSLQDYKTGGYLALIRNFRRYYWLLMYLFGASPAVCNSFAGGRQHNLQAIDSDRHSLYAPGATSLRMGDLGYQSKAQDSLVVCYNSIENYITTLRSALTEPYPDYQQAGLKGRDGSYRQLNTNLLQIENEFYSPIRPKRVAASGEPPVLALWQRGIEYIEVRCLDLNPYLPVGVDSRQMKLLDCFLVMCLLKESPPAHTAEYCDSLENQRRLVYRGRDPGLTLRNDGEEMPIRQWSRELFDHMAPVAGLLDSAFGNGEYSAALKHFEQSIDAPQRTPSARLLEEIHNGTGSYFQTALQHARQQREYFMDSPIDPALEQQLRAQAAASLEQQREIEQSERVSFDQFLADYYRGYDFELQ